MTLRVLAACVLLLTQGCATGADKEEQYELKSPCAAADTGQGANPCAKRPANAGLPDALPPRGGFAS